MKYFVFTLLGILVGLGLFSFGFYNDKSNDMKAAKISSKPNVAELQKNIVLDDPVEISKPGTVAAPAQATVAPAQAAPSPTSVTGVPVPSSTFGNANAAVGVGARAPTGTAATVGSEILPPQEAPVIYDGWANAGFLPEEEVGADIQISNLPEAAEEDVR